MSEGKWWSQSAGSWSGGWGESQGSWWQSWQPEGERGSPWSWSAAVAAGGGVNEPGEQQDPEPIGADALGSDKRDGSRYSLGACDYRQVTEEDQYLEEPAQELPPAQGTYDHEEEKEDGQHIEEPVQELLPVQVAQESEEEDREDDQYLDQPVQEAPPSGAEMARRRMEERERLIMERRKAADEERNQKDWYQKWLRRQAQHPKKIVVVEQLDGVPETSEIKNHINAQIKAGASQPSATDARDDEWHKQEWYQKWLQRQALKPNAMIQIGMDVGGYTIEDLAGPWGKDNQASAVTTGHAGHSTGTGNVVGWAGQWWSSQSWGGANTNSWDEHKQLEDHFWYQKWLRRSGKSAGSGAAQRAGRPGPPPREEARAAGW